MGRCSNPGKDLSGSYQLLRDSRDLCRAAKFETPVEGVPILQLERKKRRFPAAPGHVNTSIHFHSIRALGGVTHIEQRA